MSNNYIQSNPITWLTLYTRTQPFIVMDKQVFESSSLKIFGAPSNVKRKKTTLYISYGGTTSSKYTTNNNTRNSNKVRIFKNQTNWLFVRSDQMQIILLLNSNYRTEWRCQRRHLSSGLSLRVSTLSQLVSDHHHQALVLISACFSLQWPGSSDWATGDHPPSSGGRGQQPPAGGGHQERGRGYRGPGDTPRPDLGTGHPRQHQGER